MYRYRRRYTGKLQGVILDWAGTTVDYGCIAPARVFVEVFKAQGVELSTAEARGPMGTYKRDHIRQLIQMPAVAARWQAAHGRLPDEDDVERMYQAFIPRQIEVVAQHADLIPGVRESVDAMRARGLKIGSTTGYTRAMMAALLPQARGQGYEPDCLICPDDVPMGRPAPFMCFLNAMRLNIYPMEAMVKIGDTLADITEGLNAGMWTIGVAQTGNEVGLSETEIRALPQGVLAQMLAAAHERMAQAGAHYVVDSLADVLSALDQIEARLGQGEKP